MVRCDLGLHPVETWYVCTVPLLENGKLYVFVGNLSERVLFKCCLNVEEIDLFWNHICFDVIKDAYVYVLFENR